MNNLKYTLNVGLEFIFNETRYTAKNDKEIKDILGLNDKGLDMLKNKELLVLDVEALINGRSLGVGVALHVLPDFSNLIEELKNSGVSIDFSDILTEAEYKTFNLKKVS
jgi:hypothetical protein